MENTRTPKRLVNSNTHLLVQFLCLNFLLLLLLFLYTAFLNLNLLSSSGEVLSLEGQLLSSISVYGQMKVRSAVG